jgi:hypothetical protein
VTTPVAVGRYVSCGVGDRADVAVTVSDDWQGRGLGDTLATTAGHHGFTRFDTVVSADSRPILTVVRNRRARLSAASSGEVDVTLNLVAAAEHIVDHALVPVLSAVEQTASRREVHAEQATPRLRAPGGSGCTSIDRGRDAGSPAFQPHHRRLVGARNRQAHRVAGDVPDRSTSRPLPMPM